MFCVRVSLSDVSFFVFRIHYSENVVPEKEVQAAMKRQQQNIPLKGSSSAGSHGAHTSGPKKFDSKKGPHKHAGHSSNSSSSGVKATPQPGKVAKKSDE